MALGLGVAVLATGPAGAREDLGSFRLATDDYAAAGLKPAFVGNGYLSARVPFDGDGAQAGQDALAQVQGLFGKGRLRTGLPEVERRASLPVWTSLDYDDGSGPYSLATGKVEHYRQQLDLHAGALSTDIDWISPGGRRVALHFDVVPDRAHPHAALVRLRFTPQFAGQVTLTDMADPRTGRLVHATGAGAKDGTQFVDLATDGLTGAATLASHLEGPQGVAVRASAAPEGGAAQQLVLTVAAGQTYEVLKTVGVAVSTDPDADPPHERAVAAAREEAALGYAAARRASDSAWAALWQGDVQISDDPDLQLTLRAALYALYASARDDLAWAPSPGGLSTDGYMGHIFWDSETWMYPVYLALAPGIAQRSLDYRLDRLPAAAALAARSGYKGTMFPWESGLSGDEVVPIPVFGNERHVSSDIALAAWQSWLTGGDRRQLARIYPLLAGVADFWVSYATPNPDGSLSLRHVVPPDEEAIARNRAGRAALNSGGGSLVDDSAYTNLTARRSLQFAQEAARLLDRTPPAAWADTARRLRKPAVDRRGVLAEYAAYAGGPIKQADVALLAYPWESLGGRAAVRANLDYYAPRANPDGPSMTDAIHAILAAADGRPGCAAYTYTRQSIDPFVRPPYRQLSEARAGGVFDFTTGAGGLLQAFVYGYTGLRWRADGLWFDPSLPPQLHGVTLPALHWRGRTLKVEVRPERTVLTLLSGSSLRIRAPGRAAVLALGAPVTLTTRLAARGAMATNEGAALCRPVVDSDPSSTPAAAADDGADATAWMAAKSGQSLTLDLGRIRALDTVAISRPPTIAVRGSGGPMLLTPQQSAGEEIQLSSDGVGWTPIGRRTSAGEKDVVHALGRSARFVRVVAVDAAAARPLTVGEIHVRVAPRRARTVVARSEPAGGLPVL